MYNLYLEYKDSIDMCPKIIKKFRQIGMHAGGVCPLPGPVYNYIPVMRVANTGTLVSAFTESGQSAELDEAIGIQKIDVLAIINLDISKSAIEMIQEKLFKIEEDGIIKIVPESYLSEKEVC
jgi:DNA polymerase III alpha subunit